jgi:ribosomal protein S18 acetylase RimI-like enzyme
MFFSKRAHSAAGTITLQSYRTQDRRAVQQLLARSHRVHTHLDWYETDQWLDTTSHITVAAWQGTHLIGLLGMSMPLAGASWLRVAAFDVNADVDTVMTALWQNVMAELTSVGARQAALLSIQDWILPCAQSLGFQKYDDVITLQRVSTLQPDAGDTPYRVRAYAAGELNAIVNVDLAAFAAPWQMSRDEIRQAERQAANISVAVLGEQVIGYQLSTLYFDGAHLARLAVLPEFQGRGVGRALLYDLIQRFIRRGVFAVSVNTQASNLHSQNLYERTGFRRTGYDLPVYLLDLPG